MSLQEIKLVIARLPPKEIHELADWLDELCGQLWDKQIEADAKAERLLTVGNAIMPFQEVFKS